MLKMAKTNVKKGASQAFTKTTATYYAGVGSGGRVRTKLQYEKIAKSSAKGQLTSYLNRGVYYSGSSSAGAGLKRSVDAMAVRSNANAEQMAKISQMTPEGLDELYHASKLTFKTYFQYKDIQKEGSFYTVGQGKQTDIDFFIDQYERLHGELPV